jgi:pimeloyl-ACP methyl ester carboxylesterase
MDGDPAAPTELFVRDEGQGRPVLLLHGVGADHLLWNSVVPLLATEYRVLAPDLRGHGRSPAPPGAHMTFDAMEVDVSSLLEGRGASPVHLVGHSGGAELALRYALDFPDRVRSLVLICGAAYTDPHTRAIMDRWFEAYQREGPDAFALRVLKDVYYPDWIEDHLDFADAVRANATKMNFGPPTEWSQAMRAFDEKNRLAGVRRPTLIVQAMDDQVIDASHGRILRQSIPGAQIRIFAQTGHMLPIERPKETAEALTTFFGSVDSLSAASAPR